jgi:hypothetical protein
MGGQTTVREVAGPWSLSVSRAFWEGFTPAAVRDQSGDALRTVFPAERTWTPVRATVGQDGPAVHITVTGGGDLDFAAGQVARFLALDIDARGWPAVGERDPVIGAAQQKFPGLRPCGFHSPYEAAAWAVLSQRVRMTQAARLRNDLLDGNGAFPAPSHLRNADLDLPDRKPEYLRAVGALRPARRSGTPGRTVVAVPHLGRLPSAGARYDALIARRQAAASGWSGHRTSAPAISADWAALSGPAAASSPTPAQIVTRVAMSSSG